ncbi:hypothetical protein [Mesorhizobium japonicum]|uniref:hypothetical protein n=1 Tax=Mesorhizobium japonicum TaxID=2066070 RepID=UPI003B5B11B3
MQVDPLLSLLIGALGAALLGLLGAWIQSRREHQKWVREQRLAAYGEFLRLSSRMEALPSGPIKNRRSAYFDSLAEAVSSVHLVGPKKVEQAANEFRESAMRFAILIEDEPEDRVYDIAKAEAQEKRAAFISLAQDALRIRRSA